MIKDQAKKMITIRRYLRAAVGKTIWGFIGTMYFFAGLNFFVQVNWWYVVALSLGMAVFFIFWWLLGGWLGRMFRWPHRRGW